MLTVFMSYQQLTLDAGQFLRSIQQTHLGRLLVLGSVLRTSVESLGSKWRDPVSLPLAPKPYWLTLGWHTEQGTMVWARFSAVSCFHECFSLQKEEPRVKACRLQCRGIRHVVALGAGRKNIEKSAPTRKAGISVSLLHFIVSEKIHYVCQLIV